MRMTLYVCRSCRLFRWFICFKMTQLNGTGNIVMYVSVAGWEDLEAGSIHGDFQESKKFVAWISNTLLKNCIMVLNHIEVHIFTPILSNLNLRWSWRDCFVINIALGLRFERRIYFYSQILYHPSWKLPWLFAAPFSTATRIQ